LQKAKKRKISPKKSNILIQNHHSSLRLPISRSSIQALVSQVLTKEGTLLNSLDLNFVDSNEMRKINKNFLNHNYDTDVITFTYENEKDNLEGEIVISSEKVKKNAKFYDVSNVQELKRVIIHGCLHLAGYNDKTKKQKEIINNKENFYLGIKD
jgi:probable rRNA maturation factor